MKNYHVVLLVILSAVFGYVASAHADEWTTADTYREATFQTLWIVDALQTHTIAENADCWHEKNKYLGTHPTVGAVNRYFLVGALVHAGVSYLLPKSFREPFQYVTIGIEVGYVENNFSIGIRAQL